jgi:hypothetical protein
MSTLHEYSVGQLPFHSLHPTVSVPETVESICREVENPEVLDKKPYVPSKYHQIFSVENGGLNEY